MNRSFTLLAAVALAGGVALAQPFDGPRGPMMSRLNLTQEQQDKVQDLRSDFQKRRIQDMARLRTARIELRDLMRAEAPDRKAIEGKVRDIAAIEQQAHMNRIDHQLAVHGLLTPEQRRIWKEHFWDERDGERLYRRAPRGRGAGRMMRPAPEPGTGSPE